MKQIQIKRLLVLALCMMLLVTALPVRSAEAATLNSAKFTVAEYGANKATYYVTASNTGKMKVGYKCSQGYLYTGATSNDLYNWAKTYGWYEFQIWGKKNGKWISIYATSDGTQKNIKNSASKSSFVTVKGYTEYKIQVYAWNTKNFHSTVKKMDARTVGLCSTPHYSRYKSAADQILNRNKVSFPSITLSFSNCKTVK